MENNASGDLPLPSDPVASGGSVPERIFDWLESPWFTVPVGTIGGIVGLFFYAPILVVCGICMLLGFHRKVLAGHFTWKTQVIVSIGMAVIIFAGLYWVHRKIHNGLREANVSLSDMFVSKVKALWPASPRSAPLQPANSTVKATERVKPTFEQSRDYYVSLGTGTAHVVEGKLTTLAETNGEPIVQARLKGQRVLITARLWVGPGAQPVTITDNNFDLSNSSWDVNYNQQALEVVNEDLLPVLQIVYTTPRNVAIYGVFSANGRVDSIETPKGSLIHPLVPPNNKRWPLARLFQYPSRRYKGEELPPDKWAAPSWEIGSETYEDPWELTYEQAKALADRERKYSGRDGQNLITCDARDSDSSYFAGTLADAFRIARWSLPGSWEKPGGYSYKDFDPPFRGVVILVPSESSSPPGLSELVLTLHEIGTKMERRPDSELKPDEFRILVGEKP